MHARQAIREAAVTALTGLTTTGSRVYDTRIFPLSESALPCIAVYASEEVTDRGAMGGRLSRELDLVVRGYARGTSGVEDTLDTIAEEVETALTSIAGAKDVVIRDSRMEYDGEGDMPIATIEMVFSVLYHTAVGAPGTAI
jgi:hypothetical protein